MQLIKPYFFTRRIVLLSAALCLAVQGCRGSGDGDKPPPEAAYSRPLERVVMEWEEVPGRLESPRTVSVAARVGGIIMEAPFKEGALVNKDDVLFIIDDRPYKADFASKEADLKRAEALLAQSEAHFKRYEKLQGTRAISGEDYDAALASLRQARANVAVAGAALEVSKLNLEWTRVTAPISGRVSKKHVTEGNLINLAGQAVELTTITSIDPIYAYVTVSERFYLKYKDLCEARKNAGNTEKVAAEMQLENESEFRHRGEIDFIDNQVDPATGTIQMRAVFPNPEGYLTPGLFARMRIPGSERYTALLVPDLAINTDQNSRYLLVVGKDDLIERRPVKTGPLFGKLRAIAEGLKPDDRVLLSGFQQLRPGTKVAPREAPAAEESARILGTGNISPGVG